MSKSKRTTKSTKSTKTTKTPTPTPAPATPKRARRTRPLAVVEAPAPAPVVVAADTAKMTHPQLTKAFNNLVPTANKLGIAWAKHHTSAFERKELGVRMIAKLEAAIAQARAGR